MSGTIGIPANDSARFSFFAASLTSLIHPPNTAVRWAFGSDRIRGRNNLVRESLETGSEWLLFLDDDQAFQPDLLVRLLQHEQPIVASLYMQRQVPFAPVAYTHQDSETFTVTPLYLNDYLTDHGLVEVAAAGTGGMLIRSEVFRKLDDPWFEHGHASEDLIFCEKARDAGFPIFCDLQARMGHITTSIIWPGTDDKMWTVGVTLAAELYMQFEIAEREDVERSGVEVSRA